MKDKNKWLLIKHGRQERILSRAGGVYLTQQIELSQSLGDWAFFPLSKGSFFCLLLFLLYFIWHHRCTA